MLFLIQKFTSSPCKKGYDLVLKENVRRALLERSEATFLWVALACKRLEKELTSEAQSVLDELPTGLDSLYERMTKQVLSEPDI